MVMVEELSKTIRWIDSDQGLAEACAAWLDADAIAVDTEFVRRKTYYPIPALIQVCDGHSVGVIDPVPIAQWAPLIEVMQAPVLKVLHACSEDLEVFSQLLGVAAGPLFDTQIAAGLCGLRPSMGYNKLVQALLGLDLPKDETNSDWLLRPLSEGQLRYAAHDVIYLYDLFLKLQTMARELGREDWVLQDSAAMGCSLSTQLPPERSYLRLKGLARLKPRELAVARELCAWREREVRARDLPRNWLLKDNAIQSLCRRRPGTLTDLAKVAELQPSAVRKFGEALLEVLVAASELPPESWPEPQPRLDTVAVKALMSELEGALGERADELALAPELLLNRRQLGQLAAARLSGDMRGPFEQLGLWRRELLTPVLAPFAPPTEFP